MGVRRIIFIIFVAFLAVTTAAVLLYASGWRLDIAQRSLVRVGALFIDPYPEDATVVLGGIPRKTTSVLSPNATFTDLAPGRYAIEVGREGFYPWEKSLEILPQQTTEARHVLLIPKNSRQTALIAGSTDDEFRLPPPAQQGSQHLAVGIVRRGSEINVVTVRIDSGRLIPKIAATFKIPKAFEIETVRFPDNGERFFLLNAKREGLPSVASAEEGDAAKRIWYLVSYGETDQDPPESALTELPREIRDIVFLPTQFKAESIDFIAITYTAQPQETGLALEAFRLEKSSKKTFPLWQNPRRIRALTHQKNRALALDENGILWAIDQKGGFAQLTFTPLQLEPSDRQTAITLIADQESEKRIAVLTGTGALYLFDEEARAFIPIAEGVADAAFSKASTRLLWHTQRELWVLYLTEDKGQPKHASGERELLARFLAPIRQASWYPDGEYHVIFAVGNAIKIVELDGRDKRNIHDIFVGEEPEFLSREDMDGVIVHDLGTLWHVALPNPPRYDLGILGL